MAFSMVFCAIDLVMWVIYSWSLVSRVLTLVWQDRQQAVCAELPALCNTSAPHHSCRIRLYVSSAVAVGRRVALYCAINKVACCHRPPCHLSWFATMLGIQCYWHYIVVCVHCFRCHAVHGQPLSSTNYYSTNSSFVSKPMTDQQIFSS